MLIESQIEETDILGKLLNLTEPYFSSFVKQQFLHLCRQ